MKWAHFQIIWTAGIGELYMSVADVLNFATKCKEKGYVCSLKVVIGPDNKYIQNISFFDIFDKAQFSFFNYFIQTNETILSEKDLNIPAELSHIFTGVNKDRIYSSLQWSLFSNISNIEQDAVISHLIPMRPFVEKIGVNPTYTIMPLFTFEIESKAQKYMSKFADIVGIQFRVHDNNLFKETTSFYTKYERELKDIILAHKNVYITTNCGYLKESLKAYENILFYEYRYPDIGKYHTDYHTPELNLVAEKQAANLMDLIAEMCNLKYVSPLYSFNENTWHSQFLGPALINRKFGMYHYRCGAVPN